MLGLQLSTATLGFSCECWGFWLSMFAALYQPGCVLSSQQLPFFKGDYKTTNDQLAIFYLLYLLICASLSLKNRVYVIHIPVSSKLFFEVIFGCPVILPQLGLPLTRSQWVLQQHDDEIGENCREPNTVGSTCFLLVTSVTLSRYVIYISYT